MWVNIMSISNQGATSQDPKGGVLSSPGVWGLPDPAVMAQLANALYAALPGRPDIPGTAVDPQAAPPVSALPVAPPVGAEGEFGSQPIAPYAPPTSGLTFPGDAELRQAPASLASLGGAPPPSTAAAPPSDRSFYFLDPAQSGLPGIAVGMAPSAASRLDNGNVSTFPSPPSAVSQPAEPSPRSMPIGLSDVNAAVGQATAAPGDGERVPLPFAFYPEVVPLEAPISSSAGAVTHTPAAPFAPPLETGALLPAGAIPPIGAGGLGIENSLRPEIGSLGVFSSSTDSSASSFYFLDEAARSSPLWDSSLPPEPKGLPEGVQGLASAAYPLEPRRPQEQGIALHEPVRARSKPELESLPSSRSSGVDQPTNFSGYFFG